MVAKHVDEMPLLHAALDAAGLPESPPPGLVRIYDFLAEAEGLGQAVLAGLSQPKKKIPWQALFDVVGLQIFDYVCAQPEYLAARTEKNILTSNIGEIVKFIGGSCQYIDLGKHGLASSRILIEHLRPSIYAPLDASITTLKDRCGLFSKLFPWLKICALHADFEMPLQLPRFLGVQIRRKAAFLLGGAFARFSPAEVPALLGSLRALVGPAGRVLVSVDQTMDREILQCAYNDQRGAMAAFNLNALRHLNQACRGDFHMSRFQHFANYDASEARLDMALVSQYSQFANVAGKRIDFSSGEKILTASHYIHGADAFRAMALESGLRVEKTWFDAHNLFAVHAMVAQ